jgi:hypothetical protein
MAIEETEIIAWFEEQFRFYRNPIVFESALNKKKPELRQFFLEPHIKNVIKIFIEKHEDKITLEEEKIREYAIQAIDKIREKRNPDLQTA